MFKEGTPHHVPRAIVEGRERGGEKGGEKKNVSGGALEKQRKKGIKVCFFKAKKRRRIGKITEKWDLCETPCGKSVLIKVETASGDER